MFLEYNQNTREHLNLTVTGKLEDFDFFYYVVLYANTFDVVGYAKQKDEQIIYIEAEGTKRNLEKFIDIFREGTLASFTDYIKIEKGLLGDYYKFKVIKDKIKTKKYIDFPVLSRFSLSFRNFLH